MAANKTHFDALHIALEGASSIGLLAKDEKAFRTVFEAFRAGNAEAFQAELRRIELFPKCRYICEWIRSKECVFLCLELCGPPKATEQPPNPRHLAEAIVRITSNQKLVHELVEILDKRDREAFGQIAEEYKLGPLCHLFCHWLCVIRYRLICRLVCSPVLLERSSLADELQSAGKALATLLQHKDSFEQAVAASNAGSAEKLASAISSAELIPFCYFICEWFCSWHCTFVCFTLCREFSLEPIKDSVDEAFAFAKASATLAHKPAEVERLLAAIGTGDAQAWATLLGELELRPYCIQLCHWICAIRCSRFCLLVCPPPDLYPVFTSIGQYDYTTDINTALGDNGLTKADSRAFFDTLRLNGILTQLLGGQPMEYRFETIATDANGAPLGSWTPVLPAQIAFTLIGHWEHSHLPFPQTKKYWVKGTAAGHDGIPGPGDLVVTPAVDGWIKVPQENNFTLPSGAFSSNGNMIELISQSLAAFTAADETGVLAGSPATHPLVKDLYFGIRMRIRQVGVPASETDGGTCVHIAVDDTLYNNITLHPDWMVLILQGQLGVAMLDIAELIANPCGLIGSSLTVLFTATHPNLGTVTISMTGPGGPYAFTLPAIPEVGDWFGKATPAFTVSKLKPCAYLVTLQVTLLLTDGQQTPGPLIDQIAFCKK